MSACEIYQGRSEVLGVSCLSYPRPELLLNTSSIIHYPAAPAAAQIFALEFPRPADRGTVTTDYEVADMPTIWSDRGQLV